MWLKLLPTTRRSLARSKKKLDPLYRCHRSTAPCCVSDWLAETRSRPDCTTTRSKAAWRRRQLGACMWPDLCWKKWTTVGSELARTTTKSLNGSLLGRKIKTTQLLVFDIKRQILGDAERRSLTLNFEHNHAVVVTSSEHVEARMRRQHPESLILMSKANIRQCKCLTEKCLLGRWPEHMKTRALLQIPHTNRLVLRVRQDQFSLRVEEDRRHVVVVSTTAVDLKNWRAPSGCE